MFLSIGMLKQNYFLADIFILSAEKQPIKLSWRKIECLPVGSDSIESACPDLPLLCLLTGSLSAFHALSSFGDGIYLRAPPVYLFI